ncbi:hypothetical protein OA101_01825 [Alphaproteobacteria bacterium]|jgi:hypothetical protein|nr:hypothetical protein [Alphaproteobacteria bacterium]
MSLLDYANEHGDVVRSVQGAIKDGKFTARERAARQREINEAIEALKELQLAIASSSGR